MLACPLLRAWAPAAATKSAPRSVAGRSVCARPLRVTRLALRGGASEEEEEEGEASSVSVLNGLSVLFLYARRAKS